MIEPRKGILFCMRFPDDQGFVWRTVVKVRDRVAQLLPEFDRYIAFPQLTGQSAHVIENMQPVEIDAYTLGAEDKRRLRAFVEQNRIAAIVYMSALPTTLDMSFLHALGVKTINTEEDSFDHRQRDALPRRLAKYVVRHVLRRQLHDLHIANSVSQGEWLIRYAKIPKDRMVVIPNGIDTDHYTPAPRAKATDTLNVICVGQARAEKRIDLILRCAAKILAQDRFGHVRFTYVGDGPMMESWRTIANDLGLAGRFIFAGAQSDLKPFYQASDLMVHAAERESFGLVLTEAMACGLPIVASAAAGPKDIIVNGQTGRLVEIDDESAFRSAIEAYLTDPQIRRVHGAAGRKRVVEQFSMARQVRDIATAIRTSLA